MFCVFDSAELLKVLNRFYKRKEMQKLAAEHGLDGEKMHIIVCSMLVKVLFNHSSTLP